MFRRNKSSAAIGTGSSWNYFFFDIHDIQKIINSRCFAAIVTVGVVRKSVGVDSTAVWFFMFFFQELYSAIFSKFPILSVFLFSLSPFPPSECGLASQFWASLTTGSKVPGLFNGWNGLRLGILGNLVWRRKNQLTIIVNKETCDYGEQGGHKGIYIEFHRNT